MTNEPAQAILLVDDEPLILSTLRIHLRHVLGAEVSLLCASSGAEAIELVDEHLAHGGEIALTIVDYQMHPMKGDELLELLNERLPDARKVMLTGQADMNAVVESIRRIQLFRYMIKPWDPADLERTVREAMAL